MLKKILVTALMSMSVVTFSATYAAGGETIQKIQKRGKLLCTGHNGSYKGFAEVDDKGAWTGLDIEFCKALGTAVLGSPDKTEIVPISWAQRFPSLQSGDIDVVIKVTGWTFGRDTEIGLQFSRPYFLGATQFVTRKELGIKSPNDLDGGTVCVESGTSMERISANYLAAKKVKVEQVTFEKSEEALSAYFSKRCDAYVGWGPNLAVALLEAPDGSDKHTILPEAIAMEPESAAMRQGDDNFVDVVNWMFAALIIAEENGITQDNVDKMKAKPATPAISKLLGVSPGFGTQLGLKDDWAYNMIKAVGNYGEIYERSLGMKSAYKLPRGVNALWSDGGVMYPMILD